MIDFPGDTYHHLMKYDLDITDIDSLLLTHWHSDHLYAEDLAYRMDGYANGITNKLDIYGNEFVHGFYNRAFELEGRTDKSKIEYHEINPYQKFQIKDYTIYSLPAQHGNFQEDCFIYVIEKDGKQMFYTHDTGYPTEEMWNFLKKNNFKFDFVSMDCNEQGKKNYSAHMNIEKNQEMIRQMKKLGMCDEKTVFVADHFSHNGGSTHEEMKQLFSDKNVIIAYDGLEIEF
ncbi:MBL fold metallo-hydrolase [Lactobacillus sp. YT155]|uniref:MBL fold metallo-hydrolase n=1 Tax=Lactobacillus sp. YT155 TaxID=3060955 RepID=UPI00265D869F|nr:MBL fold metallo-hydrolase [Lactobacillus sp. YT155]MDO1605851.1 MBL fold metallo-hydrolase [Lactobacillus sp. YT155]